MALYHLSNTVFGNPQYPLSQAPQEQFVKGFGDIGRGLYRPYNPTGPIRVGLTWLWDGATLQTMRLDWTDPTKLNYGNNWFTVDLPLFLSYDGASAEAYDEDANLFHTVVAEALGGGDYGYTNPTYANPAAGVMKASRIVGIDVEEFIISNAGVWSLKPNGGTITGNPTSIEATFTDTEETISLSKSGSAYVSATNAAPLSITAWRTGLDTERPVVFSVKVQPLQRYVAHFVGPFNPSLAGGDIWRVAANLDIDVTRRVVSS